MGVVHVFVLLFLFSATLRDASAVKCASCIHLDFTPSPPPGFPNIYKNVYCKDFHDSIMAANSHECPDDGKGYVCGTVQGVYTFDVPTVGITSVEATLRRCLAQPQGFDGSSKKVCLEGGNLDKATNDINLVGATEEFGDMTRFEGKVCYCNGDNCNGASAIGRTAALMSLILGTVVAMVMVY